MSAGGMFATPPKQPAVRLVLARHGEALGNRELRYLGRTDAPLTPRGEAQARLLATALSGIPAAAIYSSPLRRAHDTAEAIGAELGLGVATDRALREQDFGAWENLTRAEVLARDRTRLAAWEGGADTAPEDGEAPYALRERVVACANTLAARHPGATIVLASHVGPIKALICAALGLPPSGAFRMWLDPASYSVVDWRPDGAGILRAFNATAHLSDLEG
ncbi:MAG TPA: histidine phosphatase family protein [Ktedonobacterales bacterium]